MPRHAWPDMIVRTLKPKQNSPGGKAQGTPARRLCAQGGFTIVEALVASLVLAVGLLAAYMMLTVSTHSSSDVRAREGAVTLARQITDDARSIPYAQLQSSSIVTNLQAM